VLDGGEKPVADMREVGSLPADEDPLLDPAGGEIETQERSIVVRAKNGCSRKLSCSLSYAVRCEDNHGKRTSSSVESAHFTVASDASAELVLSAERCQQAWTIDAVTWRCE
jgi:hypothetical protein